MRKLFAIIIGLIGIVLYTSCTGRKTEAGKAPDVDVSADTVVLEEEIPIEEEEEEEEVIQPDGVFFDFLYSFATDSNFQRRRIVFPLPYYQLDEALRIEESEWDYSPLFFSQSYYTLLFDHEDEMELIVEEEDDASVQVELYLLNSHQVKRYYFERKEGLWILEAINLRPVEKDSEENFGEFFARFATDSIFQGERVRQPLKFVTADPDDDFSILETTLELEQWFAFRPPLPTERLTNINYGQHNDDRSKTKIVALKGLGNGFSNILYFHKKRGEWELYKFEDASM